MYKFVVVPKDAPSALMARVQVTDAPGLRIAKRRACGIARVRLGFPKSIAFEEHVFTVQLRQKAIATSMMGDPFFGLTFVPERGCYQDSSGKWYRRDGVWKVPVAGEPVRTWWTTPDNGIIYN